MWKENRSKKEEKILSLSYQVLYYYKWPILGFVMCEQDLSIDGVDGRFCLELNIISGAFLNCGFFKTSRLDLEESSGWKVERQKRMSIPTWRSVHSSGLQVL